MNKLSNKLFGKSIDKICEYCVNGSKSDNGKILCIKLGVVNPDYSCKKFNYDPLKRKPSRVNHKLPEFKPEDFVV